MNVNKVMTNIVKGIEKPIDKLSQNKYVQGVCKEYRENNTKFMNKVGIGSIVLKDGIGCALYVKQSLGNKDIPEDKRKFVAALDLTNGGLMVLMQILAFKTISNSKLQAKMFNKLFGKFFDRSIRKGYTFLLNNKEKYAAVTKRDFNLTFEGLKKDVQGTFGFLTSLVAATIVAKRVIVPFIATPLADKAKAWMDKKSQAPQVNPETKNTYDTKGPKLDSKPEETNLIKSAKK